MASNQQPPPRIARGKAVSTMTPSQRAATPHIAAPRKKRGKA